MNFFELFIVYAVSWWLVLFMVLPIGVRMAEKPELGHAASAPVNPNLRKKFLLTSVVTLLLTLAIWGVDAARAESGIYHAGSNDCLEPADASPDASINTTDTDATLGGTEQIEQVPTFLDAPASDYTSDQQLDRIGYGTVSMGVATTNTKTGETRLNGKVIGAAARTKPAHCR